MFYTASRLILTSNAVKLLRQHKAAAQVVHKAAAQVVHTTYEKTHTLVQAACTDCQSRSVG